MEIRNWCWFHFFMCVTIVCNSDNTLSNLNDKPNIILVVADDLGFNDVPWHNKEVVAPVIQKLASEGVILENSYVQPVCTPSRAALLSGRYPFTIGRQDGIIWPLMPTGLTLKVPVIPQFLKPLGYETHIFGKWHLGFCKWNYTPTERGFDTFNGFYTGSEDYYSKTRKYSFKTEELRYREMQGTFIRSEVKDANETNYLLPIENQDDWTTYKGYDYRDNRQADYKAQGIYSSDLTANHMEKILASSNSQNPKFLYVPFQSVHAPLQVPKKYLKPYKHIKNRNRKTYLAMISALDNAIGRIVKALEISGRYNNSVIIFTTDNGGPTITGANNWPLRGNKTTLWEGGTRGAAFVHSPLLKNPARVSHALIHITDWLSTIVRIAGGVPPNDTDSIDQWDALNEIKAGPRKELIYNINYNPNIGFQAGIRVKHFKLLIGNPGPGDWIPDPSMEKIKNGNRFFLPQNWTPINRVHSTRCRTTSYYQNSLRRYKRSKNLNGAERSYDEYMNIVKRIKKFLSKYFNDSIIEEYNTAPKIQNISDQNIVLKKYVENRDISNFEIFKKALNSNVNIRLYNLKHDPLEKKNLARDKPAIVKYLVNRLLSYKDRWVTPDKPGDNKNGNPTKWNGVWSPGWC